MRLSSSRIPSLELKPGALAGIGPSLAGIGARRVLLVHGRHLLEGSVRASIEASLAGAGLGLAASGLVEGEPSPELADSLGALAMERGADAVLAVGGGAVLDGGKAAAAAPFLGGPVADFLEGVGGRAPGGKRLLIACVPTTAGTGSEATKNAVLSRPPAAPGQGGFKKSLRHEGYVPDLAILDPELQTGCPPGVTAASGLDAVTQLLEAFFSAKATPFTDALALEGLRAAGASFEACLARGGDLEARAGMAWAAWLSGIVLANAGLGAVHGMAGALGGLTRVGHGPACGLLLVPTLERLLEAARAASAAGRSEGARLLGRAAIAGAALSGRSVAAADGARPLLELLAAWTRDHLPMRLSTFGVTRGELAAIAAASDNKNAPIALPREDFEAILESVL